MAQVTVPAAGFDAVVFDLDGVVTDTASVHAVAWTRLFDEYLARRPERAGEDHGPFTPQDYARYVDGRPRYDGVATFLASRGVDLPWGEPSDPPSAETVHGLGSRKDGYFVERLAADGARAFGTTVTLLDHLRAAGFATGVISASRHCRDVLEAAGLADRFDVRVDGVVADEMGLPGKPDPAVFLEATRRLGVQPERTVVVEDAEAGVAAGRAGGFGLVVGVDRTGPGTSHADALREHGADVVVADLGEVAVDGQRAVDEWSHGYEGFVPEEEGLREALCVLGNGYMAVRGAAPESHADGVHYPGTYVAGCYDRLTTTMAGREVENEDLVNVPNWLVLSLAAEDAPWLDLADTTVHDHRLRLDLRSAVLTRHLRFSDAEGRTTRVTQRRLVSMTRPHVAALETTVVPENWSGRLRVLSALDGTVENRGVARYRELQGRHLAPLEARALDHETVLLVVETRQSRLRVAESARTRVLSDGEVLTPPRRLVERRGWIGHEIDVPVTQGVPVAVEKVVTVFTSRDRAVSEPALAASEDVGTQPGFARLADSHARAWSQLWGRFGFDFAGSRATEPVLRLHLLHLLQTCSPHTADLDVGVPARGLHGEAYRGHIFWDELFVFPIITMRLPELTRALLLYRYRRLDAARRAARAEDCTGAMYPWQSGSDGREESQRLHLNPLSGRWLPDATFRQRHIGSAVAYNVWQYYQATGDVQFLADYGAEMLFEIARYWACVATYDEALDRYRIRGVVGPDEFHTGYPGRAGEGVDDNAYTNVLAAWVLQRALDALAALPAQRRDELVQSLRLGTEELDRWETLTRRLHVPFHDGVISQFEGYGDLADLDWDHYRQQYGDIHRLDRILEAEGLDPNAYQASKQADVLMLVYLFAPDELREVFARLGYALPDDTVARTVDYYLARTSHGSTLSALVHAWVLARSHREQSLGFFFTVLRSDVADVQGGTTAEGVHLAAMAGSVDVLQRCFAGVQTRGDALCLDPAWPHELGALEFTIRYRDQPVHLHIRDSTVTVTAGTDVTTPTRVICWGGVHELQPGETLELRTPGVPGTPAGPALVP